MVDYAPNAFGQPTKAGTWATGVTYHPNGAMKQFTYGNGVVHTLTQNVRGLPETSRDAYGTTEFIDDTYDYDANGNVMAITDGKPGSRGSRTMAYDGQDRLLAAYAPAMFNGTMRYTYDVLDNLETLVAPGTAYVAPRNLRYCNNGKQQLAFVRSDATSCSNGSAVTTLEYDPNGNVSRKNGVDYVFDQGNRLRTVTNAGSVIAAYTYDAHGRRVLEDKAVDAFYQYTLDGRLALGTDWGQKVRDYIQLNGSLLAIRERDVPTNIFTTKYQHTDALGSPVIESDQNRAAGNVSEYEPYGKTLQTAMHDGPGYTGHVEDASTGLTYMQQRYYDAGAGRFLSVDPVTANSGSGANFNRYWYANNNPYLFTDPDGRQSRREAHGNRQRAAFCNTGCNVGTGRQGAFGTPYGVARASSKGEVLQGVAKGYIDSQAALGPGGRQVVHFFADDAIEGIADLVDGDFKSAGGNFAMALAGKKLGFLKAAPERMATDMRKLMVSLSGGRRSGAAREFHDASHIADRTSAELATDFIDVARSHGIPDAKIPGWIRKLADE